MKFKMLFTYQHFIEHLILRSLLTAQEIALLNGYLALYKDETLWNTVCFSSTLTVDNVSGSSGPPFTLTGQVELLLELELEP